VESREESLRAEGTEDPGKIGVEIAEMDRRVRRIVAVRAHLEARPRGEEHRATRGIGVEEVRRKIVRGREGVRNAIPVDFTAATGERAGHVWVEGPEEGAEGVDRGQIGRASCRERV